MLILFSLFFFFSIFSQSFAEEGNTTEVLETTNNYTCFGYNSTDPQVCSGRGNCTDTDVCVCDIKIPKEYGGENCDVPYCYNRLADEFNVCFRRGECVAVDTCNCTEGKYSGKECRYPICEGISGRNQSVCNGLDFCICFTKFYGGNNCDIPRCNSISAEDSKVCFGRGKCVKPDHCVCDDPNKWGGKFCQEKLIDGGHTCYGIGEKKFGVCSNRGRCLSHNNCSCHHRYHGITCNLTECFGILQTDPTVCNSRGMCTGINRCRCNDFKNFGGYKCEIKKCFEIEETDRNVCSGHGICKDHKCTCKEGYGKPKCEPVCLDKVASDQTVCTGHGECISPGKCECSDDYSGDLCTVPVCFGIPASDSKKVCNGRGVCNSNLKCVCNVGSGEACEDVSIMERVFANLTLTNLAIGVFICVCCTTAAFCSVLFLPKILKKLSGNSFLRSAADSGVTREEMKNMIVLNQQGSEESDNDFDSDDIVNEMIEDE